MERHYSSHRKAQSLYGANCLFQVLIASFVLSQYCCDAITSSSTSGRVNLNLGPLDQTHDSTEFTAAIQSQETTSVRSDRLSTLTTLKSVGQQRRAANLSNDAPTIRGLSNEAKTQEDSLTVDCFAKRDEVIKRQNQVATAPPRLAPIGQSTSTTNPPTNFHRLRPRIDSHNLGVAPVVLNITLANNFDGEHIPRCRHDGSYDPIQCHKIGYCWCVNRYGQAIKNSAVRSGEEPECEPSLYASDSNTKLVVAGISAQRIKNILKSGGSAFDSSTPNGHINFEATEPTVGGLESLDVSLDGHQQVGAHSRAPVATTQRPVIPLIPNDCKSSRENARNRAASQVSDSIWVPECDSEDEALYAERQCHKSKVCWCVDQSSGLPLRSGEQLSSRPAGNNCTEIKRILGLASKATETMRQQQEPMAFYQGSSEYCDADKRADFVISLNNQFRLQISEYIRQNPTSTPPTDLSSSNPFQVSEVQVARWKFIIMDRDADGKIGDREWSKFKNNFKLVEKVSELENPLKQQKSPYFALAPLLIVRSQRKCWRDFLEFCGSGDLVDETVSLPMWMSCTELPPKSAREDHGSRQAASTIENTYALSREAAIVRSQKKNPFLGILKPD